MTRKLIALLLCICMIGSMTVYAVDDVTEPTVPETTVAATEPEVTEPETTEPEVTEPETTEPETTEPEPEPEPETEPEPDIEIPATLSVYEKLMAAKDLREMADLILDATNNDLDNLMALTTEEIFSLSEKAVELYKQDPTKENDAILNDEILLTFLYLPNYREKCADCGKYPCECQVDLECTCGAEEGAEHTEDCALYFETAYKLLMAATDLNTFIKTSSTLNEIETTQFRSWMRENGLLEKFQAHADAILNKAPKVRSYSTRSSVSVSNTNVNISDALKLAKSASYNASTGKYDITLESYTTGVVEEGQILPADTVLVLDTSGSMAYNYELLRVGTPMYGSYFHHSSGNYWGWLLNSHLVNDKNPYVLLPNGTFAEAEYVSTDANKVEVFRVVGTSQLFYPTMDTESVIETPRQNNYPVYTLYSSKTQKTVTINTGVPIFGDRFVYDDITYYGWLSDSHGSPVIRLEGLDSNGREGRYVSVKYARTDSKKVEIFKYTDSDTGEVFEFYPALTERCSDVKRAENLPVVQMYSGYSTQRMAALHDAVAEFLRLTAEKNEGLATASQSRVAIVQFSCDEHGGTAPTKVLKDMTAITESNVDAWIADVYKITDGGAHTHTEIGEGMLLAEDILEGITRTSNKAVIAFTDGKPECDETSEGGFSYIETEKAISAANRMTTNFNADIYAICIQQHANVNAGAALPPNEGKGVNDDRNNINRFMHLMSSNYPDATDMTSTGTGSTSNGYYMVPGGDDDLVDIFAAIGDQIGSASINLGATATVIDFVTPYFQVPADLPVNISVKDAYYEDGSLKWKDSTMSTTGISATVNSADRKVSVTGFDYNHNFVATQGREEGNIAEPGNFYGRKLVISFSVSENEDFLGGDDVVTNKGESGIYHDGNLVAPYPVPQVNVPLDTIDPHFNNGKIYVSQATELPHIVNVGEFTTGGKEFKVDGINNAYVDIKYTVVNGTGSITYTIPAGTKYEDLDFDDESKWTKTGDISLRKVLENDTTYDVICEIISKNKNTNTTLKTEKAIIEVYKPVITFKDSFIKLGETANYAKDNYVNIVWKHGSTLADPAEMGVAPELTFTYNPVESNFTKDTPVKVTKAMSPARAIAADFKHAVPAAMDVLQHATFIREACSFSDCTHKAEMTGDHTMDPNFVVHLLRFDLNIGKTGISDLDNHAASGDNKAEYQSTIYKVENKGTGFYMEVTIPGNSTIKLVDLPAATTPYTVTEKVDWSWRYEPENNIVSKEVDASKIADGTDFRVAFNNERKNDKWLNGGFWTQNIFKDAGIIKTGNTK